MIAQQPPQGPPMINCPFAPQQPQFDQRHAAPQQFDSNLGSPLHDFLAAQQHPMQHPFDMLRPLEHLPMNPMEALNHFNLGEHARHNMGGVEDVGAQSIFGLGHHHHHHHFLEPELGMDQQGDQEQPMGPESEHGARTWGKGYGKGYGKGSGKGYGKGYDGYDNDGYDDKGYGGYEDKGYSKGYNSYDSKGYDKGYDKGYGGYQKGYSKG